MFGFRINPVATITTTVILWTSVLLFILAPTHAKNSLESAQNWITDVFTWFYIGTQNVWILFIVVLFFSKYGKFKLGTEKDKVEYNSFTWFMMLFSCGIGNELLYFGVAEPIYHYATSARQGQPNQFSHLNDAERARASMNLTFYHWGLHGWIVYCIIGLSIALMGYRKKLPLTMRSCLYPLLGDKAFGKIGDFVDILSAICTMMGICTSLGLGVIDVNAGIHRLTGCDQYLDQTNCELNVPSCEWRSLGLCKSTCEYITSGTECVARKEQLDGVECRWIEPEKTWLPGHCELLPGSDAQIGFPITRDNLIILIWGITLLATISAVTGIRLGVRALSITCFGLGMFLMGYVFFAGNPWYFLDLLCQSIGIYIGNFFTLGFHTDAIPRHTNSPKFEDFGGSTISSAAATGHRLLSSSSSSAFGVPNTKIASDDWMGHWTVFYWGWWVAWSPFVGMFIAKISKGRTIQEYIGGTLLVPMLYSLSWFCVFGGMGLKMERAAESVGLTGHQSPSYLQFDATTGDILYDESTGLPKTCLGPSHDDCMYISRMSERPQHELWFDMIGSFYDLSRLTMPISLLAILLYFVTSADSGSLVIDTLCSNGHENAPAPQKIYWAFTQGAMATAFIWVGFADGAGSNGLNALEALQAATVCAGLPYSFFLCFLCASIWKACKYESGELIWDQSHFFRTDLFDFLDAHCRMSYLRILGRTFLAVFVPTWFLIPSMRHTDKGKFGQRVLLILMTLCFYAWPILYVSQIGGLLGGPVLAWWFYMVFVSLLMVHRHGLREKYDIDGNMAEDLFASMLMYFCVAEQLEAHFAPLEVEHKSSRKKCDEDGDENSSSYDDYSESMESRKRIQELLNAESSEAHATQTQTTTTILNSLTEHDARETDNSTTPSVAPRMIGSPVTAI